MSSGEEVTENCQSLRLESSIFLLAFLPVCRIYQVITRNPVLQPSKGSLQQLFKGQGLICSLQHRRFETSLFFLFSTAAGGAVSKLPPSRSFKSLDASGKGFLCLSKLSFREARQLRPWLTACPVATHPPVGCRIQLSTVRAVPSDTLAEVF